MHMEAFECHKCGANFEDLMADNPGDVVGVACPVCGSADVVPSEAAREFLDLVRDIGSTGG